MYESACGAASCCDDESPNSYILKDNCRGYCNSTCSFIPWNITLFSSATKQAINRPVNITAVTNLDLPTNYRIRIYEENNTIGECSTSGINSCIVNYSRSRVGTFNYFALLISRIYIDSRYQDVVVVMSNNVTINWVECLTDADCPSNYRCVQELNICGNITLRASNTTHTASNIIQLVRRNITLNATTNFILPTYNYGIHIYNQSGHELNRCYGPFNSCSVSVNGTTVGIFTFFARVLRNDSTFVSSNNVTVRWVECLNDNDCPGGYRCNNQTYTCYSSCSSDTQCKTNFYCYCGVCSQTWSNGLCGSNQCCNKGFGGSGIGSCVNRGTIYNVGSISYICS